MPSLGKAILCKKNAPEQSISGNTRDEKVEENQIRVAREQNISKDVTLQRIILLSVTLLR